MAQDMTMHRAASLALALSALLTAGCAKNQDLYPSLSIRDQERVSGVFDTVPSEPFVPAPLGQEATRNLEKFQADAAEAHRRMLASAEAARGPVAAARGTQPGTDAWSIAAVAVADAEARRSETQVALAEIDLLYVAAQTEGHEVGAIVSALSAANAMMLEEDRLIAGLRAQLSE